LYHLDIASKNILIRTATNSSTNKAILSVKRLKKEGILLHPGTQRDLRRVLERQVAAAIVLRDVVSQELLLEIFRRANFLWVPA
jgi:hypothetical protein